MTAGHDYTRWDVLDARYWWAAHHHAGQWSDEYRTIGRIEQMGYRPGRIARGPETDAARMIYADRCHANGCGCTHEEEADNGR